MASRTDCRGRAAFVDTSAFIAGVPAVLAAAVGDECASGKTKLTRFLHSSWVPGKGTAQVRDVLKRFGSMAGFLGIKRASHRQFVHPEKPGKVTVAGHESDEMPPKTLKSIMKQADIP